MMPYVYFFLALVSCDQNYGRGVGAECIRTRVEVLTSVLASP